VRTKTVNVDAIENIYSL